MFFMYTGIYSISFDQRYYQLIVLVTYTSCDDSCLSEVSVLKVYLCKEKKNRRVKEICVIFINYFLSQYVLLFMKKETGTGMLS